MKSLNLTFESSAFPPVPGEDEGTNPGIFGMALALWLANQLHAAGVVAGQVIAEDFAWLIPVKEGGCSLHVACSSGESSNHWVVFVFVGGGIMDRVFGRDKRASALNSLYASVRRCLEAEPSVTGLRDEALPPSRHPHRTF